MPLLSETGFAISLCRHFFTGESETFHWTPRHTSARYYACSITLFKPSGYVTYQQFNIQQLYVLPTLYLCVLYLSENKQRLVPLTA
jgi:hypothetical protein